MISPQIEAISQELTELPAFIYGTRDEINQLLDKNTKWPAICLYPLTPVPSKFTRSLAVSNQFSIQLDFLYKTIFDQYTAQNDAIVQQALAMANEFMIKAANYRTDENSGKFFKVNVHDKTQLQAIYNKFDVNSTGIKLTWTLNTMYNTGVSLN